MKEGERAWWTLCAVFSWHAVVWAWGFEDGPTWQVPCLVLLALIVTAVVCFTPHKH